MVKRGGGQNMQNSTHRPLDTYGLTFINTLGPERKIFPLKIRSTLQRPNLRLRTIGWITLRTISFTRTPSFQGYTWWALGPGLTISLIRLRIVARASRLFCFVLLNRNSPPKLRYDSRGPMLLSSTSSIPGDLTLSFIETIY